MYFAGMDINSVHLLGTGAGGPFIYYVGKAIQSIEGLPPPGRITAIDAGLGFENHDWTKEFKSLGVYTEAIHTSIPYDGDNSPQRYVCTMMECKIIASHDRTFISSLNEGK